MTWWQMLFFGGLALVVFGAVFIQANPDGHGLDEEIRQNCKQVQDLGIGALTVGWVALLLCWILTRPD